MLDAQADILIHNSKALGLSGRKERLETMEGWGFRQGDREGSTAVSGLGAARGPWVACQRCTPEVVKETRSITKLDLISLNST